MESDQRQPWSVTSMDPGETGIISTGSCFSYTTLLACVFDCSFLWYTYSAPLLHLWPWGIFYGYIAWFRRILRTRLDPSKLQKDFHAGSEGHAAVKARWCIRDWPSESLVQTFQNFYARRIQVGESHRIGKFPKAATGIMFVRNNKQFSLSTQVTHHPTGNVQPPESKWP